MTFGGGGGGGACEGGTRPGTPAYYVGGICIITYHPAPPKKYLWIHMYHTFTLVKLAYFLLPKKIWCDTYVSFFRQETSTFERAEAHSGQNQNFFFRAFRKFSLCSSVFCAAAAHSNLKPQPVSYPPAYVTFRYVGRTACGSTNKWFFFYVGIKNL